MSNDALTLTRRILAINPDFYSLWNYRREILVFQFASTLASGSSVDEGVGNEVNQKQTACLGELALTEECLRVQPKSYWAWNHRRWILENMPKPPWKKELAMVELMLDLDARNCTFVAYLQIFTIVYRGTTYLS